ncbi:MAG: RNA-binding S4 domain-containing protein [Clostridia bacterium]|nr:RNA-binding S4 domain-containing protein [Clostridia bacterium]MBQ3128329.1 RNA-binding S4 domain-containing protein [Clostridia bacterium]MBQ7044217.1 RNA-binding S4 domain-containing protein [Clostridia bacterium]
MIDKRKIRLKIKEKPVVQKSIHTEFIRLDAFLKLCDAVQSGGHAKIVIQDGEIKVNNEICTQRGKKLHPGDRVEFENTVYEIV